MPPDARGLDVSIVIPCLNEARTIASCIDEALHAIRDAAIDGEVIVADNGSTDGSVEIASSRGARVVPVAARGYGHALREGIAAARGRFVVMGDADGSYDFGDVARFKAELEKGYDLVMGNRFEGGIQPGAMPWKNRYLGNPALSAIGRILFRSPCRDFHCGLRAFRKDAFDRMHLRTGGMEFASEMVIRATMLGLRISEIPTVLRPDGRNRPPHLRPWRDGWRHLRFMLLFSPRWLFLYPGMALILAGAGLGARLIASPITIGSTTLDVHTLLFCAIAILIGFQAVLFAILTKVFAIHAGLRPPDPRFMRVIDQFSLELGLQIGGAMVALGLGLAVVSVALWGAQGFGALSPQEMLRWVIPAGTLLALGCQLVLGSFFLGILGLKVSR